VPVPADALAELIVMTDRSVVSSTVAKDVFDRMWTTGRRAREIVDAEGLGQVADESALAAIVDAVMRAQTDAVTEYRAGRTNVFGFLVGQAMKASGGKADPKTVTRLLKARLEAGA
jgi:aspartyl-tRNA(Asn)/glutamyl-tRNA(Gln) amidotransferase subunit B